MLRNGEGFWEIMDAQLIKPSFRSLDFVSIFLTALFILLLKTVAKYMTKLHVFISEGSDSAARRSAHFDTLRVGVVLSIIGLVATFAVFREAIKIQPTRASDLVTMQQFFTVIQLVFVLLAIFFSAIFYSPQKTFHRGWIIPFVIGFFSLWVSIGIFHFLLQG